MGRKHSVVSATGSPQKRIDIGDAVDQIDTQGACDGSMRCRRNDQIRLHHPAALAGVDDGELQALINSKSNEPRRSGACADVEYQRLLAVTAAGFSPAPRRRQSTCP